MNKNLIKKRREVSKLKNKFYEIKNIIPNTSADLYIYGEIVTDDTDWWTGEKDNNLIGLQSFKEELDKATDGKPHPRESTNEFSEDILSKVFQDATKA